MQGAPENATFSTSPCSSETKRAMTILFAASFVSQKNSSGSRKRHGSIFTNNRDIQQLQPKWDTLYIHSPVIQNKNVTRKLQPKWREPYRNIEQKGPVTFRIRKINGRKEEMVHANRLKIYGY